MYRLLYLEDGKKPITWDFNSKHEATMKYDNLFANHDYKKIMLMEVWNTNVKLIKEHEKN